MLERVCWRASLGSLRRAWYSGMGFVALVVLAAVTAYGRAPNRRVQTQGFILLGMVIILVVAATFLRTGRVSEHLII